MLDVNIRNGDSMMSIKQITITQEGYDRLVAELEHLKTVTRGEVAERLKLARSYGDLSENSEYDEAKDEQARVENKIAELENTIKNAKIMDVATDKSQVSFGCTVKIYDMEFEEEETYTIVGSKEVDPSNNKISSECPLGKALIGAKIEDIVTVKTQESEYQVKVLEIL